MDDTITNDERRSPVPNWCVQPARLTGPLRGCAGSEEFDGCALAREAWGEDAKSADSGLTAFAYLWRRFGPPWCGSDNHKQLCRYIIGTPIADVYLTLGLSGSPLVYAVGFLASEAFWTALHAPRRAWWDALDMWAREHGFRSAYTLAWNKDFADDYRRAREVVGPVPQTPDLNSWCKDLNRAVYAALREMLRTVFIRDVPINILGRTGAPWDYEAKPSRYAGLCVPVEAMDALFEESPADG